MMEGVSSTMTYCKNFCECHNTPQYNNNVIKNQLKKSYLPPKILHQIEQKQL
jgi:hypothetical protein